MAKYTIVAKYVSILKDEGYSREGMEDVVDGVFYYMGQICRLLGGEWLFWQA